MGLRQLEYVEVVARHGGFRRAAEQLHVAQPAVSAQIARLERELGVRLFERTSRRVELTQAGRLVLGRARRILSERDAVRADLDELAQVLRGTLRLGVTAVLGSLDLPAIIRDFHRRYPSIDLTVRAALVDELLVDLANGRIDVAIAPIYDDLPEQYVARPLVTETLILATPPGLLAARRAVRLTTVRDQPFVSLGPASRLRKILADVAAQQGFSPRIQFEAADPAGIRALISAGLGVGLLAESLARADGPPVDVHHLTPAPWYPPIGLIRERRRRIDPTLRAWLRHLAEVVPRR